MSPGPDFAYAVVRNQGVVRAHIAEQVAWRTTNTGGSPHIEVREHTVAVCGWNIRSGADVLLQWGSSPRCVPCEIVARYRGYTIADDHVRPGEGARQNA